MRTRSPCRAVSMKPGARSVRSTTQPAPVSNVYQSAGPRAAPLPAGLRLLADPFAKHLNGSRSAVRALHARTLGVGPACGVVTQPSLGIVGNLRGDPLFVIGPGFSTSLDDKNHNIPGLIRKMQLAVTERKMPDKAVAKFTMVRGLRTALFSTDAWGFQMRGRCLLTCTLPVMLDVIPCMQCVVLSENSCALRCCSRRGSHKWWATTNTRIFRPVPPPR